MEVDGLGFGGKTEEFPPAEGEKGESNRSRGGKSRWSTGMIPETVAMGRPARSGRWDLPQIDNSTLYIIGQ